MIKINLIPPEYIVKLDQRAMIAKAVLFGVVSVSMVAMISVWHFTREKTIEIKMSRLQVELKNLQADVDKVKAIEAEIAEVQRYLGSINSIAQDRLIYPHFLQRLTSALPGTIWFGGVRTSLAGSTLSVECTVTSRSAYDLAYWINALETEPKCSEVTVGGISAGENGGGKTLNTTLTFKYAYR